MRYSFFFLLILFGACAKNEPLLPNPYVPDYYLTQLQLYGGSNEDIAHAVINTVDGGFAVIGNTTSTDGDLAGKALDVSDILLLKFDEDGSLEWSRTYGGTEDDRGHSLVELPTGGYALLGYAMSSDGDASQNQGQHDNWVIRVDAQGDILWERSFGFLGHDHAYNIIATQDGGLFFNGFLDVTASQGEGSTQKGNATNNKHGVGEFWCHKIDAQGNIQWRRYFGGTNNDRSYDALELDSGEFILVGTSESDDVDVTDPKGGYDMWVIKLSATGTLLWERSFGGTAIDGANAVVQRADGLLCVLGNSFSQDKSVSTPLGRSDIWLVVMDEEGNLRGEYSYGGSEFDLGRDLISTDNYLWLVGYSRSNDVDLIENQGENDVILLQLGENFLPQQRLSLGGEGEDFAHSLVQRPDGSIVVVGSTESRTGSFETLRGEKDIFIAQWDTDN